MSVHLVYNGNYIECFKQNLEYTGVFQQVVQLFKISNLKGFSSECSAIL